MSTQLSPLPKKVTTEVIHAMKLSGEKISVITAYDYTFSKLFDSVGVDVILVGDSLGNVICGYETTLPVTIDQMIYHATAVVKGAKRAMIVVDMPFLSFQVDPKETMRNAGKMLKESGAHAVKIEGGKPMAETIRRLVEAGMPVMGHLGLTPQSIHQFGSYKVRAKETKEAERLLEDAKALEGAGCFSIVLEKIPAELAKKVTDSLQIPTIGIGAGSVCDGQVLVSYDLLGLNAEFKPKFVRRYAEFAHDIKGAVSAYISDIKTGKFPSMEESY